MRGEESSVENKESLNSLDLLFLLDQAKRKAALKTRYYKNLSTDIYGFLYKNSIFYFEDRFPRTSYIMVRLLEEQVKKSFALTLSNSL
jgi:hypothetical protein